LVGQADVHAWLPCYPLTHTPLNVAAAAAAAACRELMDAIQAGVCEVIHKNKEFRDLKYMRIDGSTPAKQREANVNQFQQDDNCRVRGVAWQYDLAWVHASCTEA
jgi:hypothetical protein